MEPETLTDELLEQLLASATPEAYLDNVTLPDRTLSDYARELLDARGITRADVIRASGLNATFAYQVFQGERGIGRDHAIMLAFGLGCSLVQTQRLLRLAGVSELWCKVRRDAIIIYCVDHGMSRAECDDELYRLGEPTLVSEGNASA